MPHPRAEGSASLLSLTTEGAVMDEKCAVVTVQGSKLAVAFFGVIVYIDDPHSKATIRHERKEVILIADLDAGIISIRPVGDDGKTEILTHSTSH
jgi:hypothetical protein